ncbi:MAG: hypothetical protein KC731_19965 [Myxococcales bacterium]|nr:hypothetical protein [Myxococcales bacterium]
MIRKDLAFFFAALFFPAACGGASPTALCDRVCDCTGCSDSERDDCVDTLDDAQRRAENAGCGDAYDDYLSCIDGELTCLDGKVDADGCESEAEAVADCGGGIVGGVGNACEAAANRIIAKFDSCGIDTSGSSGGGGAECSAALGAQAQCLADCVEATSCATLQGTDQAGLQEYSSCVAAC